MFIILYNIVQTLYYNSVLLGFTCAVYRAVHLELVSSLSTESFMQALRRFWARRGRGSTLYTDNGTNFVGAANALKSLDWDFIQAECSLMKIKWLFSPPSAPWYGGFWDRMVRSIKELHVWAKHA
ncbi:hypothetical protein AVEN_226020-1 [Araneus ventricosus]|uniref:Integrase catalytic domain-containing protein n=1 Tax=Araneus ventricosus TaxID=182803 RepID=A0A4Y2HQV0_ARAVE|nr:hypothetical protein AVEN_226020-1 [Araneus ventricosus]